MDKAQSLQSLEADLARLMPRGLGESARLDLEALVDDLAGAVPPARIAGRGTRRTGWLAGCAAVVTFGLGMGAIAFQPREEVVGDMKLKEKNPEFALLQQVSWIEGGADLGIQSVDESGDTRRRFLYTGVEEERVLHKKTGYEVVLQRGFEAELYAVSSL